MLKNDAAHGPIGSPWGLAHWNARPHPEPVEGWSTKSYLNHHPIL